MNAFKYVVKVKYGLMDILAIQLLAVGAGFVGAHLYNKLHEKKQPKDTVKQVDPSDKVVQDLAKAFRVYEDAQK